MSTHHRPLRPFALTLCLLLAPALNAAAQSAKSAPQSAKSAPQAQATPAAASAGVVNINTASAEELARLPGVGPSRAQAILELRTRMKGFKSVEDLMRVRGIGRKTFRKLQPMLRLQGETTLAARPSARPAAEGKR